MNASRSSDRALCDDEKDRLASCTSSRLCGRVDGCRTGVALLRIIVLLRVRGRWFALSTACGVVSIVNLPEISVFR
jgi:hypothetical protein